MTRWPIASGTASIDVMSKRKVSGRESGLTASFLGCALTYIQPWHARRRRRKKKERSINNNRIDDDEKNRYRITSPKITIYNNRKPVLLYWTAKNGDNQEAYISRWQIHDKTRPSWSMNHVGMYHVDLFHFNIIKYKKWTLEWKWRRLIFTHRLLAHWIWKCNGRVLHTV